MSIKIRICLIIITGFFMLTAHGQNYYQSSYDYKPVSFGITLAPHMDWLGYGDTEGYESSAKFGYSYGLIADFAFSENYYFSTGLTINTMNHEAEHDGVKSEYRLQYAEIPIALKLKSTQRYFRSYYGQFGFSLGTKVSGKEKLSGDDERRSLDADIFRLALQIGGGIEWQLDHNLHFLTGLTYNNGFTKAIKSGSPKNSYFALNFAIMF
ncbi:Outer membrane protein beta-barrel domain-containing protein [bacterium A37T11]|nr:Outer membrane protein beta-barrel domain-containing protein [bacterium A37T11]